MSQHNYDSITFSHSEPHDIKACAFCGDMTARNKKIMPLSFLSDIVDASDNMFRNTPLLAVYTNICQQIQDRYSCDIGEMDQPNTILQDTNIASCQYPASVTVCINCFYWTSRHKAKKLLPLLHLKWYINTLHVGRYGVLDKRVFHRLCYTLHQRYKGQSNFFRTLFTQSELEVIDYVATQPKQDLPRLIAAFFHANMASSLLLHSKQTARLVREASRHSQKP